MNEIDYLRSRIEVARGYGEYIPEDYDGWNEQERFGDVLDSMERIVNQIERELPTLYCNGCEQKFSKEEAKAITTSKAMSYGCPDCGLEAGVEP